MVITLLTGLLLLGIAAALAARAVTFNRMESGRRLRSIEMYGFRSPAEAAREGVRGLTLRSLAESAGSALLGRWSGIDRAQARRDLLGAGVYALTPEAYIGYRAIGSVLLAGFFLVLCIGSPGALAVAGIAVASVLGWRLPMVVLQRRAKARTEEIDRELPELIDLLVVGIEAGVGLAGALQMMAERMHGPLGVELRLMQQEQSMGLSSDHALSKLLDRCETASVRSFVRSLQQGERLGVSIGQILRNLAADMRTQRRQLAEERAQKAPVKILFPLVFLIFPAMFIVLLGPAVFAFKDVFG